MRRLSHCSTVNGNFPIGVATSFTVPNGVTSCNVIAVGAAGGDGIDSSGGKGATVTGSNIAVNPGDNLIVFVDFWYGCNKRISLLKPK